MSKNQKSTKGNSKSKNSSSKPSNARVQNKQKKNQGSQKQQSVAVAYSSQQRGSEPKVRQMKDCVNVVHRELIGNVSGTTSSDFTEVFDLELNPGISDTFPWLSRIAQNYETYKFRKLKFVFVTRTGSTTVGSLVMAPDYDAADSQPATEQQMSTYVDVIEDVPWKDFACNLKPASMHPEGKRKFIRTEALANNLDIKTYDVGRQFVFAVDSVAAGPWGKVWVEYDVELHTPQTTGNLPVGTVGGTLLGATSMSGALPFGTAGNYFNGSSGLSYSGVNGNITFQKTGWYLLTWRLVGTVISAPVLAVVNATDKSLSAPVALINAGATQMIAYYVIEVTTANATANLSLTATTVTASQVYIASAPFSSLA